jgi:formate dehydrogenase subunit gamma
LSVFATVSLLSLTIALLGVVGHFLMFGSRRLPKEPGAGKVLRHGKWERAVHTVTALSFLALAASGLGGRFGEERLEAWLLLTHMVAAPFFMLGLTAMAIAWAERCRCSRHDGEWLRRGGGYFGGEEAPLAGRFDAGQKVFFWCVLFVGLLCIGAPTLAMLPTFGQRGQEILGGVHRYAGLTLTLLTVFHTYVVLVAKPGTWGSMVTGHVDETWAREFHRWWWEDPQGIGKNKHVP